MCRTGGRRCNGASTNPTAARDRQRRRRARHHDNQPTDTPGSTDAGDVTPRDTDREQHPHRGRTGGVGPVTGTGNVVLVEPGGPVTITDGVVTIGPPGDVTPAPPPPTAARRDRQQASDRTRSRKAARGADHAERDAHRAAARRRNRQTGTGRIDVVGDGRTTITGQGDVTA